VIQLTVIEALFLAFYILVAQIAFIRALRPLPLRMVRVPCRVINPDNPKSVSPGVPYELVPAV